MTKILIIGLTAGPAGLMERQAGNMAIFISTLKILKDVIPDVQISTSLQLSEDFCNRYGLVSLKHRSFYEPNFRSGLISLLDYMRSGLWYFFKKKIKLDVKFLIKGVRLKELIRSDMIIDFSGDMYGDNGHPLHLLKHSLDMLTARLLEKPVFMFAQSPGPFTKKLRLFFAKYVLNKVSLITTREPWSYEILKRSGINKALIIKTACPAFLLPSSSKEKIEKILKEESIKVNFPLVGINICGWNFIHDRYKEHREDKELMPLVVVIKYLLEKLKINVLLIPHVFRTDKSGKLIHGPDTKIIEQLYRILDNDRSRYGDRLKILKGIYESSEIKGIIGRCNLFISGRIHAGVAALSQNIPTILLAYAYKHYGFARLVGQERYVSNNFGGKINAQDVISKIEDVWNNKEKISLEIKNKMPRVRQLVLLNATITKEIIDLIKRGEKSIPSETINSWLERGDQEGVGSYFDETIKRIDEIPELY